MISNTTLNTRATKEYKTKINKAFNIFRLVKGILHLQLKQLKTGLLVICAFFGVYVLFFSILYPGDEGFKTVISKTRKISSG